MNSLSLGIPGVGAVSPGTHFCALYSGPAERDRLLSPPFLEEGLRHGDKVLCLIDHMEPTLVRESVDTAIGDDFDLLRAAGEMSWVLPVPPGWEDLFLYESALNRVVEEMPAILMCLYDLQKFGTEMLVEVLRIHPTVLLDRTVIDNPHYVHPTEYPPAGSATAGTRYPMIKVSADGEEGMDRGWVSLTDAERRVVSWVAGGMTNRSIAEELHLSRHTVDAHLKHVYLKLDIHSRVELTVLAMQHRVHLN